MSVVCVSRSVKAQAIHEAMAMSEPQEVGEFEDHGPDESPLVGSLSSTGWTPPPTRLGYTDWAAEGRRLRTCHHGVLWGIGDWLNYGEVRYGETYVQAADETGYSSNFLRVVKHVAGRFPVDKRNTLLSFSHHQSVAPLDPDTAQAFLTLAAANGWGSRDLREKVADVARRAPRTRKTKELPSTGSDVAAAVTTRTEPSELFVRLCEDIQEHLSWYPLDGMHLAFSPDARRLAEYVEIAVEDFLTAYHKET
jgi:hypothetical protein